MLQTTNSKNYELHIQLENSELASAQADFFFGSNSSI